MSETNGEAYGIHAHIDEHFLAKYRELLDAEDSAFDDLEHAYEDGDRAQFDEDLARWKQAVERRERFLDKIGLRSAPSA